MVLPFLDPSDDPPEILVIGSTGLLGRAITVHFLMAGYRVTGTYHKNETLALSLKKEWAETYHPLYCDLSKPEKIAEQLQRHMETINILVCAIGPKERGLALTTPADTLVQILQQAVASQIEIVRLALRPMIRKKSGRVLMLGSRAGHFGLPGQAAYAAAMSGLEGWVKSVAGEVGPFGITINIIAPGAIQDPENVSSGFYSEAEEERVKKMIGCGRLGHPDEIAAVVGFIASADASYINGAVIAVDGAARF